MNVIIIHGCPSDKTKARNPKTRTYNKHWMEWTKEQLLQNNIKVDMPLMPTPWEPIYDEYAKVISSLPITEETILIGHSCGATFLVQWLGKTNKKVRKLILVAAMKKAREGNTALANFYNYPINESIKNNIQKITYFTSDTEEERGKESLRIFYDKLGGKIINIPNHGHYILKHMGTKEFPELIEEILNI